MKQFERRTVDILANWLNGSLPDDEYDVVTDHVENCPVCQQILDSMEREMVHDTLLSRLRCLDTGAMSTVTVDPTPIRRE